MESPSILIFYYSNILLTQKTEIKSVKPARTGSMTKFDVLFNELERLSGSARS